MKHFVDRNGDLWALKLDGSQDALITEDMRPVTDTEADALRAAASPADQQAMITRAVHQRLNDFARGRGYDNMLSACTYASSGVPKFRDEGQACVALRDATWSAVFGILGAAQLGSVPMPTSIADIADQLPALAWPD
jgi:hypothetical protein